MQTHTHEIFLPLPCFFSFLCQILLGSIPEVTESNAALKIIFPEIEKSNLNLNSGKF